MNNLSEEARSFDRRVRERIAHGLIPDLQNCKVTEWFYNNPWRHPEYVQMVFGEYLEFAINHIPPKSKILEVGSGMGHMALEMVRHGCNVTGVELSPFSVEIARKTTKNFLPENLQKKLNYIEGDFFNFSTETIFDAACIFLTLHHFEEPSQVVKKVAKHLRPQGKIVVVEPARDWFSKRNAAIAALIRQMLSITGYWYEELPIISSSILLDDYVTEVFNEYREAHEKNEEFQSPNDNSAYAEEMLRSLREVFDEVELKTGNTLVPRLVGGVRAPTEQKTLEISKMIKRFDDYMTSQGFLDPSVFYFAGVKKLPL